MVVRRSSGSLKPVATARGTTSIVLSGRGERPVVRSQARELPTWRSSPYLAIRTSGLAHLTAEASTGLAVDLRVRTLVLHQAEGFRERGLGRCCMNTLWGWGRVSWAGCGPDVRRGGHPEIDANHGIFGR